MEAQVIRFGTGPRARVSAMKTADRLRSDGIAAAALFKPSHGGWIVRIFPGGIRPRPSGNSVRGRPA